LGTWEALSFSRRALLIELSKNKERKKRQFYRNVRISFSLNLRISASKSFVSLSDCSGATFDSGMLRGVKNPIGDIDAPTCQNQVKYRSNSFQKPSNLLTIFIEFNCKCHIAYGSRKLPQTCLFQTHWTGNQQGRQSHTAPKWHQVSLPHKFKK